MPGVTEVSQPIFYDRDGNVMSMEALLAFSLDGECVEGTAMDIVESDGKTAFKMSKQAFVIIQPSLRLGYKFAKRIDYQDSGDIRLT